MIESKILYVFITHQNNIDNCYGRISNMMKDDFVIIIGGSNKNFYNKENRILELVCNDGYSGLPEKVIKGLEFISNDDYFNGYTHYCKLDDDMILNKKIDIDLNGDYMGVVQYLEGNRNWHKGKCNNHWDNTSYLGSFTPWCMGGFGYLISKKAIFEITPNEDWMNHIYEDVYIALLLKEKSIYPKLFDLKNYIYSPEH